jgi:hypothetical protein
LAREPSADCVNGNSVASKSVGCEGLDVFILMDMGPVPFQNCAAIGVDFAECDGRHSGTLKPKAEPANAGK